MSAGTGRNLPYYKYDQLDSLTLTDSSKYMLWHANKKFQEKYASKAAALPVSFFLSDAQQLTAPAAAAVPSNGDAAAIRPPAQGLLLAHADHAHTASSAQVCKYDFYCPLHPCNLQGNKQIQSALNLVRHHKTCNPAADCIMAMLA